MKKIVPSERMEQDFEETLPALKFPLVHHVRIRTSNLLERLFARFDAAPKSFRDSLPRQVACRWSSPCWSMLRKDGGGPN